MFRNMYMHFGLTAKIFTAKFYIYIYVYRYTYTHTYTHVYRFIWM